MRDLTDEVTKMKPTRRTARCVDARDICVVLNGGSGNSEAGEMRTRIAARFADHGISAEIRVFDGRDIVSEAKEAVADGFDTVVAAGGDGTITAVAGALAKTGVTLGVLPLGTFNFIARGLGIPEVVEEAVDALATGTPARMIVAEVNGRLFLNNASLGLYPHILEQREGTYARFGRSRLAAHWSVLKSFLRFREPLRMNVNVDGVERRRKTPLAFVGRSAFQLEYYGLEGAEAIRDDRFALFLAPDSTRWQLFFRALRLASKGTDAERDFELFSGDEIVIETSQRRQSVAMDGERFEMEGPFRFRLHRDWLTVIAPRAAIENGAARH